MINTNVCQEIENGHKTKDGKFKKFSYERSCVYKIETIM